MPQTTFTPQRERTRHDAIVERARRATPAAPLVLFCPREPLATALEARVARAGGGFLRVLAWDALAGALEETLGLPEVPAMSDTARAALVEHALAERAKSGAPALAAALRVDPYGVALALLAVLDELRLAGWSGEADVVARACPDEAVDPAGALVRGHLALLADALAALEHGLVAAGATDLPARLRRIARAPGEARPFAPTDLIVEGLDRVRPLERAVLERVADGGTRVDMAPWVHGWTRRAPRPLEPATPPRTALEAFARLPDGAPCAGDDGSIREVRARDPDDEAEGVARWLAAREPARRTDVAILVPGDPGYPARVARALARYGIAASYATQEPVARAPLWQVVRASVRLAWRGADAIDLATVLTAPGAGIWGGDRDRFCARLRERVPTAWDAVREELSRATDPATAAARPAATQPGAEVPAGEPDPERVKQLAEARARVEALIALWDDAGPFHRKPSAARLDALERVVTETLARFANPVRFRESFAEPRIAAAWANAAYAIGEAARAVLARLRRSGAPLLAHDPSIFLAPVERLLGSGPDALLRRREDAVRLLVDTPIAPRRPATLVVLGFQRGRFPGAAPAMLLLGPLERAALARAASVVPGLAEVIDEGTAAALVERDARRALSLPSESLVVVSPRRDARGEPLEPALARRDLFAAYPAEIADARLRAGPVAMRAWIDGARAASAPPRAALCDAVERLGARDLRAVATSLAALAPAWRDLFAGRFRPDTRYSFGPLVAQRLASEAFSPGALETLLKCRYSFLASALLRIRELPLARTPGLSIADRTAIAHAALRVLDRADAALTAPEELDAALDAAIATHLPWGDRAEGRLEVEEVRRTVRGFLSRYGDLRRGFGTTEVRHPPAPVPDANGVVARPTTRVAVPTREADAPRELRVMAEPARVEVVRAGEGAEPHAVLVELRLGGVEKLARQRDAGLGVAHALLPAIAEATHGVPVAAVATLSLARAEADVVARPAAAARIPRRAGRTTLAVDETRDLDAMREALLARISTEIDAIVRDGGAMPPHSHERRTELEAAGATSCEYCAARLLCRFDPRGGAGR